MRYTKNYLEFLLEYNTLEDMADDFIFNKLKEDIKNSLNVLYGENSSPSSFFRQNKNEIKKEADALSNHLIN